MTSTTKTIFERFEIRKTKKQKTAFLQWAQSQFQQMGYGVRVEEGSLGVRNLVVGDVDRAKVIFTAHYDTCARMPVPNLITPACISGFVAYQLVMLLLIFGLAFAMMFAAGCLHPSLIMPAYYISIFGLLALMLFGPANRHTANDNTSGVTAIMDLAQAMPEELRGRAAFVLFDLEEMGLIGSSSFAKRHKAHLQQTPVINLDCISDGETLVSGTKKGFTASSAQAGAGLYLRQPYDHPDLQQALCLSLGSGKLPLRGGGGRLEKGLERDLVHGSDPHLPGYRISAGEHCFRGGGQYPIDRKPMKKVPHMRHFFIVHPRKRALLSRCRWGAFCSARRSCLHLPDDPDADESALPPAQGSVR